MASVLPDVPFVGRDQELRTLAAAHAAAGEGAASLVVVGGDAGVGKTRLLAEFTAGLDALVLQGGCLPLGATGLPFSPVVEVLRGLAGAGTVVLVLEDLHWADRSTRQLLAFVAHALRSQRLLVVATYRADDLHRRHPLRPLLAELRRGRRARLVELAPFAPAEVAEYLAAATGSRPSPETVFGHPPQAVVVAGVEPDVAVEHLHTGGALAVTPAPRWGPGSGRPAGPG